MPNSLRVKLSKLRYKGEITQEEYAELIKKLDGHDSEIKGQIIRDVLETVKEQNEIYLAEREKQIRAEAIDNYFDNIKKYCRTSSCIGCRFCNDETCEIAVIKEQLKGE